MPFVGLWLRHTMANASRQGYVNTFFYPTYKYKLQFYGMMSSNLSFKSGNRGEIILSPKRYFSC